MEIQVQNRQRKYSIDTGSLRNWLATLLSHLKLEEVEVSLVLVSNPKIKQLNHTYRKENYPTDVLAFPLWEGEIVFTPGPPILLGDIVISVEKAARQAQEHRHSLETEMAVLVVHGLLHLLGYDHINDAEASQMQRKERELLTVIAASKSGFIMPVIPGLTRISDR